MDRMYRVLATLVTDDNLDENFITNTYHFLHYDVPLGTTPEDSSNDMFDQVEAFYTAIQGVIGNTVTGVINLKSYDLNDPEPRVPVHLRSFTIAPSAQPSFPHEVAVALSLKADSPSGTNPRRRRGRIYLGPIQNTSFSIVSGGPFVSTATITTIADAALASFNTGLILTDPHLAVYSKTDDAGGASLRDSFHPVREVLVDNEYDTIRSRGRVRTNRLTRDWTRAAVP